MLEKYEIKILTCRIAGVENSVSYLNWKCGRAKKLYLDTFGKKLLQSELNALKRAELEVVDLRTKLEVMLEGMEFKSDVV